MSSVTMFFCVKKEEISTSPTGFLHFFTPCKRTKIPVFPFTDMSDYFQGQTMKDAQVTSQSCSLCFPEKGLNHKNTSHCLVISTAHHGRQCSLSH